MRVRLVEQGAPARDALFRTVREAKAGVPLAPVTVVVPSTYAGLSLRRALGRESGLVNVRFLVLARLAELLGAAGLVERGRRPLTGPIRTAALRTVLATDGGAFASVASHPATERALAAAFAELRPAGDGVVDGLAARPDPARSVARLYRAYRAATGNFYDEEDLARAAADAIGTATADLRDVGRVVVHLPRRLSPGELELVRALDTTGGIEVLLGVTGDDAADTLPRDLAQRLGSGSVRQAAPASPAMVHESVSAPDPEDEVREAIRIILARAEHGTPLHRIAVVWRADNPYARLARELFDASGVPWTGPSIRRLHESMAGRGLVGVLRLADDDFRRDTVAEWLASGPVLDPAAGRAVPAHRWDTLSRRAGVVRGLEQWSVRLDQFARQLEAEAQAAASDDETADAARRAVESDREHVARLRGFVDDLGRRLTPPDPPTWPALVAWARDLLRAYLGGEGRRGGWPELEVEAARKVTDALDGLEALTEIGATPDVPAFLGALEVELDAPFGRVGRFGHGVFAGRLRDVYATDFDVVIVLGMAEGVFPPRGSEDPLLPDRDRDVTDGWLPLHDARRADERRDYLAALAAAPERIAFFPRADPRAQRKRLPARWLLESAEALAGRPIGGADLDRVAAPWHRVVESFEAAIRGDSIAVSVTERDVRALRAAQLDGVPLDRHPLVTGDPALRAGMDAIGARRSARATRFDGFLGPRDGLVPGGASPVSPTALEDWATCPFRYFLGRVLRVREVPRPEEIETLAPLERGALVHSVLQEFLDTVPTRRAPDEPWSAAERAALLEIAEAHCDAAERAGLTGRPVLWKIERHRILRMVREFLDADAVLRSTHGVVPVPGWRERTFGFDDPPIMVSTREGTVAFRGRLDRLDRAPDGSEALVVDYKTGRSSDECEAGLDDGTRLQLPVYALAAERLVPGALVHAEYLYLSDGESDGFAFDEEHRARFEQTVGTVVEGISGGMFPARPGDTTYDPYRARETWQHCRSCAYDRVCPTTRDDAWERKRHDPAIAVYRRLAEGDGEVDP